MKDFLKGLLALPLVLVGGVAIYIAGALLYAVVGSIVVLVVVLTPFVLRFVGILLAIIAIIWMIGKAISEIQSALKDQSQ